MGCLNRIWFLLCPLQVSKCSVTWDNDLATDHWAMLLFFSRKCPHHHLTPVSSHPVFRGNWIKNHFTLTHITNIFPLFSSFLPRNSAFKLFTNLKMSITNITNIKYLWMYWNLGSLGLFMRFSSHFPLLPSHEWVAPSQRYLWTCIFISMTSTGISAMFIW